MRRPGYLDGAFIIREVKVSKAQARAELTLVLETGARYYFGGITILGAPEYPEGFLRRYLEFQAGDVYSHSRIDLTKVNFANSDRFKEITIDADKTSARDYFVPVTITLVSSDPKRFRWAQDSRPITVPPSPPSTRTSTFFLPATSSMQI